MGQPRTAGREHLGCCQAADSWNPRTEPLIWGISGHVSTVLQGMFHRQVPWDMERVKAFAWEGRRLRHCQE